MKEHECYPAPSFEEQKKVIMRTFPFKEVSDMLAVLNKNHRNSRAHRPFFTTGQLRRTARGLFDTLRLSGEITSSSTGMLRLSRTSNGWLSLEMDGPSDYNGPSNFDVTGKAFPRRTEVEGESWRDGAPHQGMRDGERR